MWRQNEGMERPRFLTPGPGLSAEAWRPGHDTHRWSSPGNMPLFGKTSIDECHIWLSASSVGPAAPLFLPWCDQKTLSVFCLLAPKVVSTPQVAAAPLTTSSSRDRSRMSGCPARPSASAGSH